MFQVRTPAVNALDPGGERTLPLRLRVKPMRSVLDDAERAVSVAGSQPHRDRSVIQRISGLGSLVRSGGHRRGVARERFDEAGAPAVDAVVLEPPYHGGPA